MKLNKQILNGFISPNADNLLDVKDKFDQTISQLLNFLTKATANDVLPSFSKLNFEQFLIPDSPLDDEQIRETLKSIYSLSMNAVNPKYMGHMDSISSTYSVLGDLIAAAINNNLLSLEMSPYLTQLEYSLTKQFAILFGLADDKAGGVLTSGGSLANLQALIVARNSVLNLNHGKIVNLKSEPVLFASEHAHASIIKAAMIIGIGVENVIKIKTNAFSQMCVEDLLKQINYQLAKGNIPFAIVATAGTTVTGSIDPLLEIASVAKCFKLWLHIDAIYAGALIFSKEYKLLLNGIELADSISFNPQKWLYIAKTCSMILFKDFNLMKDNFQIAAPYMREQNEFTNLGEISIQGSKHAEVLKLWLSLLSFGKQGYSELIKYSYFLTQKFIDLIKKYNYLEISNLPETNIICFRIFNDNLDSTQLDKLNSDLQQYLIKEANYFLSLPKFNNQNWLRAVLLNPFIIEDTLNELFLHVDNYYKKFGSIYL